MLIAEIGNNHFGDFFKAKALIYSAIKSGADMVKGQAFVWADMRDCSMPLEFYKKCQLSFDEYVDLIRYARELGSDMFYSIFSGEFEILSRHQNWHKIAGSQVRNKNPKIKFFDNYRTFVSVPQDVEPPLLDKAHIMFVSDYLSAPSLRRLKLLQKIYRRPIGYSDHTEGIQLCSEAVEDYGCKIIEKHFTLEKNQKWNGIIFRDTVHAATPDEFKDLAKQMGRPV